MIDIKNCIGFDWDSGNKEKNSLKHFVSHWECEGIFFNEPLLIHYDLKHSQCEERLFALGMTDQGRKLFIVYTIRDFLIRVISAKDMSKKEREIYDKAKINS